MIISKIGRIGKFRATLLGGIALSAIATAALADINTLPSWNGTTFISIWGVPNTATYGQTFTASSTNARLSSFTFQLSQSSGTAPQYQAFVYAWDSLNNRITGSSLFTSATQTAPTGSAYTAVTINTGAPVVLTPGQQYVVLFTTSSVSNGADSDYRWGSVGNNTAIPNGQFVYMNNGTNFGQLSTNTWNSISQDLALNFVLSPLALVPQLSPGSPTNAVNVATAFDASVNAGNAPAAGFNALYALTGANLNNALHQLDGEIGAKLADTGRSTLNPFLNTMLDHFSDVGTSLDGTTIALLSGQNGGAPLPAQLALGGGHLWLSIGGSQGHTGGDPLGVGSHTLNSNQINVQGGADFLLDDNAVVGLSVGHAKSKFSLNGNLGNAQSNVVQAGAYGSLRFLDSGYLSAAVAYAWHNFRSDRVVTVAGADALEARFSATNFGGRVEGGYRLTAEPFGITPYAAVQFQQIDLPGYSETATQGSASFALTYAARKPSSVRTELGINLDTNFDVGGGMSLKLFDRMAWAHDNSSTEAAVAAFGSMPGSTFTVFGAQPMRDAGLFSLGAQFSDAGFTALRAQVDALVGSKSTSVGGSLSLSVRW